MTLGAYPLGLVALGAKETPEPTLTIQSALTGLSSDNLTLIKVLVIQNSAHGLMSDMAGLSVFTPNPNRTLKAIRARLTSSPEAENRITQPTNN